jgi:hypothetical protein
MTSQPASEENDTNVSLPAGEYQPVKVAHSGGSDVDSTAASGNPGLSKVVVVRGACDRTVSVPYSVEKEQRRMQNLRSNGWSPPAPSTEAEA